MRPQDRENARYTAGAQNRIASEEELMFSLLPDPDSKKLLDIGCGIGTIGLVLSNKGFEVTGIDFSEVAVGKSRQAGLKATVCDVDKDGLVFPDESFDVVWAGDVIEHVFDPLFLLEETVRVMKRDGRLILSVPNDFYLRRRWKIFVSGRSVQSGVYRKFGQCKHHTFFSWDLLEFMLDRTGLTIERYAAVCRSRRSRRERLTENRTTGRLFGRKFVIRAAKA